MAQEKRSRWHRLDNTANLFPVIASKRFSNVYRLAVNLAEPVVPELLQAALEKVLPWFSAMRVTLKHGLFWHYLENNDATPYIQEEDDYPCRFINAAQNNGFLFRVTYYDTRINLEIFHVITDGTGGLRFLSALCAQYLMLAYPGSFTEEDKAAHWFAQHATNVEDSYLENYTPTKKRSFRMGKGYRIRGGRNPMDSLAVTHAYIKLDGLKKHCKALDVTVGQYLTACIAWAIYTEQLKRRPTKNPVNIFLPVNLRNLFPSNTSLNFFSNVYISLDFSSPPESFEQVLVETKRQFEEKVTKEAMLELISYTVGSGYSAPIRVVPLPIKTLALRMIFESSAGSSTLGFTNVGVLKLPEKFARYVTGAHVLLSAAPREPFKVAALSYGSELTLSISSTLRSTALQKGILRRLCADGMDVTVETNGVDYDDM